MKSQWAGLPLHLYALFVVSTASLILIIGCFFHAWNRPVNAISGIAPYSDIVSPTTGKVLRSPPKHYALVDIQPGDYIVEYDGFPWEHVQRLNLHQFNQHQPGDTIVIWVKRGNEIVKRILHVSLPSPWERLVLLIPVLSALICWLPTTFLLWRLSRELRAHEKPKHSLAAYQSGIPLWFLTWQSVGIAQSLGSLKYPVALLAMDVLIPIVALLVAATSFPYPLAPRNLRYQWLTWVLVALGLTTAMFISWHGFQSPFPSDDWRWRVQLLAPSDLLAGWVRFVLFIGISIAGFSIVMTTSFGTLVEMLEWIRAKLPSFFRSPLVKAAQQIERIYSQCPTSLRVIARFQLIIVLVYLVFDLVPRLIGEGTGGYSVLFAAIPLSYLLLWSDLSGQEQVWRGMNIMLGFVLLIQIPNLVYRVFTVDQSTNLGDILTILFIGGGTILGGIALALEQWQRRRASPDSLPKAIDELFSQQTQEHFWKHLVREVGTGVGVRTWMWVTSTTQEAKSSPHWHIVAHTPHAKEEWLSHPTIKECLQTPLAQPMSVLVQHYELPSMLILLPVYRSNYEHELLIAANPNWAQEGLRLLDPLTAGRLKDAITTLRFVEQQQELAKQQQQLAEERLLRSEAYRQLERKQASEARSVSLIAFALLHNDVLQRLPFIADRLRRMSKRDTGSITRDEFAALVQEVVTIDVKIRDILQDLRVRIAREQLVDTLQDMINRLQHEHPAIAFESVLDGDTLSLSDAQRDLVFLVVKEALDNAIEHAKPSRVKLFVRQCNDNLEVEVSDDGRGFVYEEIRASQNSLGLLLISDLAEALGGKFTVQAQPDQGCRVCLSVPM